MMSDTSDDCIWIIDTHGLIAIAHMQSDNIKPAILDALLNGKIGVHTPAWKEFESLYDEKAAELKPYVARRFKRNRGYEVEAARITEKSGRGFLPYDMQADLYSAAVCSIHGHTLITDSRKVPVYQRFYSIDVIDLAEWIDEQKNSPGRIRVCTAC